MEDIFVLIKLSDLKYIFFKTVLKMSLSMIETYSIFNRNILFKINFLFTIFEDDEEFAQIKCFDNMDLIILI